MVNGVQREEVRDERQAMDMSGLRDMLLDFWGLGVGVCEKGEEEYGARESEWLRAAKVGMQVCSINLSHLPESPLC